MKYLAYPAMLLLAGVTAHADDAPLILLPAVDAAHTFHDGDCAKFHIPQGKVQPPPGYTIEHVACPPTVPIAVKAPSGPSNCLPWPPASDMTPIPCSAPPPEDRSWHLMSVTYGGTVTLLKGLTHHEAEFMYDRLMGLPAAATEKEAAKEKADDDRRLQELADSICREDGQDSKEWREFTTVSKSQWVCRKDLIDQKRMVAIPFIIGDSSALSSPVDRSGNIKSAEIFQ